MKQSSSPDTRRRLLEAADALFTLKSVEQVSVREIVAQAGVTKPVLYYYFKSKEELCRELIGQGAEQIKRMVLAALESEAPLESKLAAMLSSHMELFKSKPQAAHFALRSLVAPTTQSCASILGDLRRTFRSALERAIARAEKEGEIGKGRGRDVLHLVRAAIAHFIQNLRPENASEFDSGLPGRLARLICQGARCATAPPARIPGKRRVPRAFVALLLIGMAVPGAHSQGLSQPRSLTLDEAVEKALANNTSILNAEKSRQVFQEQVREYWSSVYPEVKASAQYTRNLEIPSFFLGGNKIKVGQENSYAGGIEATQVLWAGGKVTTGVRMAKLMSQAGDAGVLLTRQIVTHAVRRLYYDLLLATTTVSIQEEALALAKQHLSTIEAQYRQGISSDLIVLRQKVEVTNTEPAVTKARNLYQVGILHLDNLLGLDPDDDWILSGTLECRDGELPPLEALTSSALLNRPEARQSRLNLELTGERVVLEQAFLYPDLQGFANKQFTGQSASGFPGSGQRAWSAAVGLRLSLPIFSGGSTLSRMRQAKIEKEKAAQTLEETRRRIRIEVRQAWLDLSESRERSASQETAVEQARKALEATESRFKNGLASQLELNDATLAMSRARLLHAQARHDVCVSLADLDRAAGR